MKASNQHLHRHSWFGRLAALFEYMGLDWAGRWLVETRASAPTRVAVWKLGDVNDLRTVDLGVPGQKLSYARPSVQRHNPRWTHVHALDR